jgi:hypothetical protein
MALGVDIYHIQVQVASSCWPPRSTENQNVTDHRVQWEGTAWEVK